MMNFQEKKEKLKAILTNGGKPAIAFSGGVDSSLLLYLAVTLRKGDALGIFAVTPAQSDQEKENAIAFCHHYHLPLEVVNVDIFQNTAVAENHRDRCYHCKTMILDAIKTKGEEMGCSRFFDGSIADDQREYRPGEQALKEAKVLSPLAMAGFNKTNVRNYACDFALKNWNKPSTPCLLTRFPYDIKDTINLDDINKVAEGEKFLKNICRHNYRLRWEGHQWGRIEAAKEDMEAIVSAKSEVLKALEKIGFTKVTLDLRPFQSGSFDRE